MADVTGAGAGGAGAGPGAGALVELSSSALPPGERFDWYVELVRAHVAPFALHSAHAHDFTARVAALDLGTVQITDFTFDPLRAVRTPRHVRRGDPEAYQLGLVTGSPMRVAQRGSEAVVGAGGLVLSDSSHPLEADVPDGRGRITLLSLPKHAFPLPAGEADRVLARRLVPDGVTGALLCQCLATVRDRAAELGAAERHRLATIAVDLAAAFVADRIEARHLVPARSRQQALRAEIGSFIESHLGEPDLTPARIAARHHVSLRTLHRLFEERQESVAHVIRRRRLERCRADLADPRLAGYPIAALAARWGLPVPAEFSRAFRAAYGVSPRDFRRLSAAGGGTGAGAGPDPALLAN